MHLGGQTLKRPQYNRHHLNVSKTRPELDTPLQRVRNTTTTLQEHHNGTLSDDERHTSTTLPSQYDRYTGKKQYNITGIPWRGQHHYSTTGTSLYKKTGHLTTWPGHYHRTVNGKTIITRAGHHHNLTKTPSEFDKEKSQFDQYSITTLPEVVDHPRSHVALVIV